MKAENRRQHSIEFKAEAVKRFREAKAKGTSIRALAEELGIVEQLLYSWAKQQPENSRSASGIVATAGSTTPKISPSGKKIYSEEVKDKARALFNSGVSKQEICNQLDIKYHLIQAWCGNKPAAGAARAVPVPSAVAGDLVPVVNGASINTLLRDVMIYLRHAEENVMDRVRAGKLGRPDEAHLLTMLAAEALKKAINS